MHSPIAHAVPGSGSPLDDVRAYSVGTGRVHDPVAGPSRDDADLSRAVAAVGDSLRALSSRDAAAVLESLSAQATALSLVLAADAAGAIELPASLREIVQAAVTMPAFLGGA